MKQTIKILTVFVLFAVSLPIYAQDGWLVNLQVSQGNMQDNLCMIGTHPSADDSLDTVYDVPAPPIPPGENYVRAVLIHTDWESPYGEVFSRDIRQSMVDDQEKTWTITFESSEQENASCLFVFDENLLPENHWGWVDFLGESRLLGDSLQFDFEFSEPVDMSIHISTSNATPMPFHLLLPDSGAVLTDRETFFRWERSIDPNPGDELVYTLQLASDPDFENPVDYPAGDNDSLVITDLMDDYLFWWRIYTQDDEGTGIFSTESWSASTYFPDPPSSFHLVEPADSTTAEITLEAGVNFTWNEALDPDTSDIVTYEAVFHVVWEDTSQGFSMDTTLVAEEIQDTLYTLQPPDTLFTYLEIGDSLEVEWFVRAFSSPDTVASLDTFNVWIKRVVTGAPFVDKKVLSDDFVLTGLNPNPFNAMAVLTLELAESQSLSLNVFNVLGQRVFSIPEHHAAKGNHRYRINGDYLATGIYFLRIQNRKGYAITRKITLLK